MAHIWLINPAEKPKPKAKRKAAMKTAHKRKRRTAAQVAAAKKLNARRRKAKAAARRHYASNPADKPASRHRRRTSRHAAPVHHRRRYRRNPSGMPKGLSGMKNRLLIPALRETAGALGLDLIMGYGGNMLPASLTTGYVRHVTKGVLAVILGMAVSMVHKRGTLAPDMARGALTVTLHDALKEGITDMMPSVHLGDVEATWVDYPAASLQGLGYISPAPVYNRGMAGIYEQPAPNLHGIMPSDSF